MFDVRTLDGHLNAPPIGSPERPFSGPRIVWTSEDIGYVCSKCRQFKPPLEFRFRQAKNVRVPGSHCKQCTLKTVRNWESKNPEKAANIRGRANKKANFKRRGIVTVEQYDAAFALQNGLCAICQKPSSHRHRKTAKICALAVDHDHATGGFRGLLCKDCNNGLGLFRDSKALLLAAAAYLGIAREV